MKIPDIRDGMIRERFKKIRFALLVASGKGGVGKSIISATSAALLAREGFSVGLLDLDLHGPSAAAILGVTGFPSEEEGGLVPPTGGGVKVMTVDLFARGRAIPMGGGAKRDAIKELMALTDWGELDYLVVDLPPGCLPANTLVMTPRGSLPIVQLQPGMEVFSVAGLPSRPQVVTRRVVRVIPQGRQPVYELRAGGRIIRATPNHPFLKYHRKLYWVKLEKLKPGDRILVLDSVRSGEPPRSSGLGLRIARVKWIREAGVEPVYDLQIDADHNFIANGVVVHNTGDETMVAASYVLSERGALLVTTPSLLSVRVARRAAELLLDMKVPLIGVVENMATLRVAGREVAPFGSGASERLASELGVPFLGRLPLDPQASAAADAGEVAVLLETEFAESVKRALERAGLLTRS